MATISTINGSDTITSSRTVINTNFSNLNTDKIETSDIDTDTALTANSDAKIPSQKAVKAYVDAGGNVNASTTVKGIVEIATQAEVDAGTSTGVTGATLVVSPSELSSVIANKKSITAGETINGATTPVPVYQDKTDFEFYACDANDTAKTKFLGFAVTNGTNGGSMTVQFVGIVGGFTGLTRGEKYYLQDAVGTIGTSIGTYEVLVGIAISTTEILIQKGRRVASGNGGSLAQASGSLAVTTGFRPSKVVIHAQAMAQSSTPAGSFLTSIWSNGVITGVSSNISGTSSSIENSNNLYEGSIVAYMTFSITSVTDTGFTVTWTETGNFDPAGGAYFVWEAEGEL